MTEEYAQALKANDEAFEKFSAIRKRYRARECGDAEFLKASAEYTEAGKAFDAAFAKEAAR